MGVCQDKATDVLRDDAKAQGKAQGILDSCVGECTSKAAADVPKIAARVHKAHKP